MSRWYDTNRKLLGLVYLFLSAKTRINDADYSLFEESGKSIEGFSGIKGDIIGDCEKLLAASDGGKTRFEIVSDLFSKETSDDPMANRSVLWVLSKLYHQNPNERKKQLVDLWVKESKIAKDVFFEMMDICETEDAIAEYLKWLETNKIMSYQELGKDLKSLQQSVSDLIALG